MFYGEGLVGKGGVVVYACAPCAIGVEEVAALDHEVLDLEGLLVWRKERSGIRGPRETQQWERMKRVQLLQPLRR